MKDLKKGNKQKLKISILKTKKIDIYKSIDSYSLLTYKSDKNTYEIIWNGTNRDAPEILEIHNRIFYKEVVLNTVPLPEHKPKVGDYILVFMTPYLWKEKQRERCKPYWNFNIGNVKERFDNFEELVSIASLGLKKEVFCLLEVTQEWLEGK